MILLKIPKMLLIIFHDLLMFVIIYLPGESGKRLRYMYYHKKFGNCGRNVDIDVGVVFEGIQYISIGENVRIDKYCIISTGKKLSGILNKKSNEYFNYQEGEIIIGNNVHIAQFSLIMGYGGVFIGDDGALSSGTKIYSLTNVPCDIKNPSKIETIMPLGNPKAQYLIGPIYFDRNVWLALNCLVFPGSVIGKNSFAANNSVITGRFPENSFLSGHPAVRIKSRFKAGKKKK